jgi:class 3 adenylate cyclase/tetratricopeptide (TPR) repeat protein
MNCPTCTAALPDDAAFCGHCGSTLRSGRSCARCGKANPPEMRFCLGCGNPLLPIAPEHAPRTYTPKHLAEKILTTRAALEGERKHVTVLFADVKGSMEIAEQVDPEEWHRILDGFFTILAEGVHRFEGTVNQYTGDGIMALFGAPIAHEDHAQRACWAALHLRDEIRRYADELRVARGLNLSVRMGLNSGEVVVGRIGDDLRMDYTAQGHTVGLAARMEQLAQPGTVLLTEETAGLVSGYFRLRELGAMQVKGVGEPLHVCELEGVGPVRARLDISRARGFSKFVGRSSEMAALEAALERASGGNGQVVGVVGEPGAGKSRLCFELAERCRARDIPVYEAQALPHGKTLPLLPILELTRVYFGITERDTARACRDKIAGRMVLLDPRLGEALPLMFDFLGVPDPERPAPTLGPEARQRQLFEVIRRMMRARSGQEPALLLFEDLHWIDGASEPFLENFVEGVPGTRTLILLNFRPEYHARWMQKSYYQQLPLLPLGPEAIAALLTDLLGAAPSVEALARLIRERTGGNPFFIEEVVQSLVESGRLEGARGAYRLVTPVESLSVPPTVQAVLASRIDRLGENEKWVLQTASVIGNTFTEAVLKRVAELSEPDVDAALRSLEGAEFLYPEALYPEAEYAFKHPLTQEVAYRSQLSERRARVHAAVARVLEELDPTKLDERAALFAYHWESAGEAEQAIRWHRRAAEWAGASDPAETLKHWQSVRTLLGRLPATRENRVQSAETTAEILLYMARTGAPPGDIERLYTDAREAAARTDDPRAASLLLTGCGLSRGFGGASQEALDLLGEATKLADQTREAELRITARFGLGLALVTAVRLAEGLRCTEEIFDITGRDPTVGARLTGASPYLLFLAMGGVALAWAGRIGDAERGAARAIELAREHRHLLARGIAHACRVYVCEISGDAASARAHGREAAEISERFANEPGRTLASAGLGLAHVLEERWAEALDAVYRRLGELKARGNRFWEPCLLAALARARLGLGDQAGARQAAEEAVQLGRDLGARLWEFPAQLALVRVLRETEGVQAASAIERILSETLAFVDESGAKGWKPFVLREQAELARMLGDEGARERLLREAHRLFTEMGAPIRAEQVLRQLERR